MHDVGKQRLPKELLAKPGALSPEEWEIVKQHPLRGQEILVECEDCPEAVLRVALEHHERLDGSGYPAGLHGDGLHPHSRIAAVANAFDALTADRVYRKALAPRQALMQIFSASRARFDAASVSVLVKLVGVYPVGTRVLLNTGESAVVVAPNPDDTTRPVIDIDRDHRGRSVGIPLRVELQTASYSIVAAQ